MLKRRRQQLSVLFKHPAVFWSGEAPSRNFPANTYPFRANSHFLYFTGYSCQNAAVCLQGGTLTLYVDEPSEASALWHGPEPSRDAIAQLIGASAAFPLAELGSHILGPHIKDAATVLAPDSQTQQRQQAVLGRSVLPAPQAAGLDRELAIAITQLRLCHDDAALAEMRQAAAVTVKAHQAGMQATGAATHESGIRATMEQVILAQDMTTAYGSIVTVHGEVLHNHHYYHAIAPGDLLLADVGAETLSGWAADVTRTWPVSGTFSSSQRSLYSVVLAAHDACIAAVKPGVEYREIHLLAAQVMAEGLVDLGILQGNPTDLVEQDAHALFFPHGVGHLLGLDVHDMEDLGDIAGYELGRQRSDRFGLGYLRLDRPLQANMVVTIEPGFYQVPAILQNPVWRSRYQEIVNWDRLAEFADVRGIRIEDDVLVTTTGHEVLTADLPTAIADVEALVQ
ncbi:MAG: aminopeptidase P family protein [Cyanothece sp. SIO2G6]|nr:aminopeptidase P family protein [Cyanothece sp. SIO2G6]